MVRLIPRLSGPVEPESLNDINEIIQARIDGGGSAGSGSAGSPGPVPGLSPGLAEVLPEGLSAGRQPTSNRSEVQRQGEDTADDDLGERIDGGAGEPGEHEHRQQADGEVQVRVPVDDGEHPAVLDPDLSRRGRCVRSLVGHRQ